MKNRYVMAADVPLIAAAAFGAFALRFDLLAANYRPELVPFIATAVLVKIVVFYLLGLYGRYWAYASVRDLAAVVVAVTVGSIAVSIAIVGEVLTHRIYEFSRSVLLIDWALTLLAVGGLRMSVRIVGDLRRQGRSAVRGAQTIRPVLVIGAGDAGSIVVREMQKNPHLGMRPAGFLDDDRTKIGKRIYGVTVLGPVSSLADVSQSENVDEVIIAMPRVSGSIVRRVAEECRKIGIRSRTVPGVYELIDGKISVSRLRQVQIADLLRRPVVVGRSDASAYLRGRNVLVTGAGGSIGLELCRQVAHASPSALVLLGHGENSIYEARAQLEAAFPRVHVTSAIGDIRDEARMRAIFARVRPNVVFHAAAHKHVPLMEENPEEAIANNVVGTQVVTDLAARTSVERLVLISTDKAVSPTSIMGASKRLAENIVLDAARRHNRQFVVVRFGNVLGSRGSVVPAFTKQIEQGGPITVTHPEMRRFFMTIPEAVDLVLHAGGLGRGGELFVLNMGEPVRIVDLATDLITLSGLSTQDVPVVFTGLRPGEKLEEALWEDGATVAPTQHPDVLQVTEHHNAPLSELPRLLADVTRCAASGDRLALEAALAEAIPTFAPMPPRLSTPPRP